MGLGAGSEEAWRTPHPPHTPVTPQVAVKNNIDVFYFSTLYPLHILFVEDGKMGELGARQPSSCPLAARAHSWAAWDPRASSG